MKLLLDDEGHAVLKDEKPVYVHDDGQEVAFDAPGSMQKIKELNGESAKHRKEAQAFKEQLEKFGETKPEDAIKAIQTLNNLDDKKLVDAKEVEVLKRNLSETFEAEKTKLSSELETKDSQIYDLLIGNRFAESAYLAEKVIIPSDMCRQSFGNNFKVENDGNGGLTVNGYLKGEKIFSREHPGEPAGFEESLRVIIDAYPMKDRILKAPNSGGSGSGGGQNNTNGQATPKTSQEKIASGLAKMMN